MYVVVFCFRLCEFLYVFTNVAFNATVFLDFGDLALYANHTHTRTHASSLHTTGIQTHARTRTHRYYAQDMRASAAADTFWGTPEERKVG